jgi:hypothetical protein
MRCYHKTLAIAFLIILAFSFHSYGATNGGTTVHTSDAGAKVNLELIQSSKGGSGFIRTGSGNKFIVWGFNYDHDDAGQLIEDYWHKEWPSVVED